MVQEEIIKLQFGKLERRSGVPIYKQLEANIAFYIASSPNHTYFPSEREISRVLNIHRKTVARALEVFFISGKLLQTGKGTFTSAASLTDKTDIHELNLMTFPLREPEKRILKILSYENVPAMADNWHRLIRSFERQYPGTEIRIDFNYPKLSDLEDGLYQWLADSEYDAVQMPVSLFWKRDYSSLFAETSPAFRRLLDSPEFRTRALFGEKKRKLPDHFYPICFGCRFCSVNLDLVKKAGIRKAPDDFRELIQLLIERKDRLPAWLADHPDNIVDVTSFGQFVPTRKNKIYRSWFGTDDPDTTGLFRTSKDDLEYYLPKLFLDSQVILGPNGAGYTLPELNKTASFPLKHYLPLPDPGCHTHFGANLFAVTKHSAMAKTASDFFCFLYGAEAQDSFADCGMVPARIGSDPHFVKQLGGISLEQFHAFVAAGRERNCRQN